MFTRYAIYFIAADAFAAQGAAWLGWDIENACAVDQPSDLGLDLPACTARATRYGFHGTVKAPFALADGTAEADLVAAFQAFCQKAKSVALEGLEIAALGRFLAFVPVGDVDGLNALAASVVRDLDPFRAPATEAEMDRRRKANLSPAQEANLRNWGYPHVMDTFRFHMTLTSRLPRAELPAVTEAAHAHFAETVPSPLQIDALALVAEREDGKWQSLMRLPLV